MHKQEAIHNLEEQAQIFMELAERLKGEGGRPITESEMLIIRRAMVRRLEDALKEVVGMYLGGVECDYIEDYAVDILRYNTALGDKPGVPEELRRFTK